MSHCYEEGRDFVELRSILENLGFEDSQISRAIEISGVSSEPSEENINTVIEELYNQTAASVYENEPRPERLENFPSRRGFATTDGFQAVQILQPTQSGNKFQINPAFTDIFTQTEVVNLPVAIYSLAGTKRQGKSFLLTLFLRYLKSRMSSRWLEDKHAEVSGGFGWRGGVDRCTEGIWIWNEPFFVESEGKKVVIFLMDTQGAFDSSTSMEGNSLIFALSTLISSFQIFNIKGDIDENHLQNLQLFTNYGKMVREKSRGRSHKPFQSLMFLLRDWNTPGLRGISGGNKRLDKMLRVQRNAHKDIQSVRENIRSSFELVECCLLPHPGKTVDVRDETSPPLYLKDIDNKFLNQVNELVQHLFLGKIMVKQINGNDITGRDLVNLVASYWRIFESGKLPKPGLIMKATAEVAFLSASKKFQIAYDEQMLGLTEDYLDDEALLALHKGVKGKIVDEFDKMPKMGDEQLIQQHRTALQGELERRFDNVKQINTSRKEKLKGQLRDELANAESLFQLKKKDVIGEAVFDSNTLQSKLNDIKDEVLHYYVESTRNIYPDFVAEYKEWLNRKLESLMKQAKEENQERREKVMLKISNVQLQAKEIYIKVMKEKCDGKCLSETAFQSAHDDAFKTALEKFSSVTTALPSDSIVDERSKFLKILYDMKTEYQNSNKKNRQLEEADILKIMNEIKEKYNSHMEEACGFTYASTEIVRKAHTSGIEIAKKFIDSKERIVGAQVASRCRAEFDSVISDTRKKFETKNQLFKNQALNEFKRKGNQAFSYYEDHMTKEVESYCDNLESVHHKIRRQALDEYKRVEGEPNQEYQQLFKELENKIERKYKAMISKNEDNKRAEAENAQQILEDTKTTYQTLMQQKCGEKYVDPIQLTSMHVNFKGELQVQFYENTHRKFHLLWQTLDTSLERQFEKVKEDNEKNKPFDFKKLGSVVCDGLGTVAQVFAFLPFIPPPARIASAIGGAALKWIGKKLGQK